MNQEQNQALWVNPWYEASHEKGNEATGKGLSRLMANTIGLKTNKRRILMSTTPFLCRSWRNKNQEISQDVNVQRLGAQRNGCAHRTISEGALLTIPGVIPLDMLPIECKRINESREERGWVKAHKPESRVLCLEHSTRMDLYASDNSGLGR